MCLFNIYFFSYYPFLIFVLLEDQGLPEEDFVRKKEKKSLVGDHFAQAKGIHGFCNRARK